MFWVAPGCRMVRWKCVIRWYKFLSLSTNPTQTSLRTKLIAISFPQCSPSKLHFLLNSTDEAVLISEVCTGSVQCHVPDIFFSMTCTPSRKQWKQKPALETLLYKSEIKTCDWFCQLCFHTKMACVLFLHGHYHPVRPCIKPRNIRSSSLKFSIICSIFSVGYRQPHMAMKDYSLD